MYPAAAASNAPDTDQLPPYLLFRQAVAHAQLAAWLPRGRHTIVDVSGPQGPGAELAARQGIGNSRGRDLRSARTAVKILNAAGITATQDAATMGAWLDVFGELDRTGQLNGGREQQNRCSGHAASHVARVMSNRPASYARFKLLIYD